MWKTLQTGFPHSAPAGGISDRTRSSRTAIPNQARWRQLGPGDIFEKGWLPLAGSGPDRGATGRLGENSSKTPSGGPFPLRLENRPAKMPRDARSRPGPGPEHPPGSELFRRRPTDERRGGPESQGGGSPSLYPGATGPGDQARASEKKPCPPHPSSPTI